MIDRLYIGPVRERLYRGYASARCPDMTDASWFVCVRVSVCTRASVSEHGCAGTGADLGFGQGKRKRQHVGEHRHRVGHCQATPGKSMPSAPLSAWLPPWLPPWLPQAGTPPSNPSHPALPSFPPSLPPFLPPSHPPCLPSSLIPRARARARTHTHTVDNTVVSGNFGDEVAVRQLVGYRHPQPSIIHTCDMSLVSYTHVICHSFHIATRSLPCVCVHARTPASVSALVRAFRERGA